MGGQLHLTLAQCAKQLSTCNHTIVVAIVIIIVILTITIIIIIITITIVVTVTLTVVRGGKLQSSLKVDESSDAA